MSENAMEHFSVRQQWSGKAIFKNMTRETPKMGQKKKMKSSPTWCKQTILVFFASNVVLSGPKKSSITSSETIRKIEITNTHSCRRNVSTLLNVPQRPSFTVGLDILLCLSLKPVT